MNNKTEAWDRVVRAQDEYYSSRMALYRMGGYETAINRALTTISQRDLGTALLLLADLPVDQLPAYRDGLIKASCFGHPQVVLARELLKKLDQADLRARIITTTGDSYRLKHRTGGSLN